MSGNTEVISDTDGTVIGYYFWDQLSNTYQAVRQDGTRATAWFRFEAEHYVRGVIA